MYRNILVPYDGSQPSNHALNHAVNLARIKSTQKISVEVHLLYVVGEIHVPPSFGYGIKVYSSSRHEQSKTTVEYIKEIYHELRSKALDMLNSKKKEYLKETNEIAIKTHVLLGHPADKIIEFANMQKIDLIVMGTVGLKGISRIKAVGSVARRVAEMASCPLLLVH
jgi:nucleotide-binding universal stress UspA family protein